ncbi:uncharacterized protein [Gossypium hirsutum]|uniref:GAG-pre-integrase domain-containing protein n=1 Tax=Gossypium hirsutum TaxID=3635 RepID=A0ABM3B036_GOSHI|nr:uncharacterized protein LOC121223298 [Gossypium hirsutum]
MKEEKTVKQYSDRIMAVVNSIRLPGEQFSKARIVEKVVSTLLERRKEELTDWRSTKKVPFKPRPRLPRGPLPIKARSLAEIGLSLMLQEERTNPADIAKGLVIQKRNASLDHTHYAKFARRRGMLKSWLLDSGCTNHMTPNATIFKSLDRSCKTKVKIGNCHFIKVEGRSDVLISNPTGNKLISSVLLVPEIDRNLLSIAQLLEKGYCVVFKSKDCQISDPSGSKFMAVTMADKSFVVDWTKGLDTAYTVTIDESKLWHQRLGHANYKSMDQQCKDDLAENFIGSVQKQEVCEICQLGKQATLKSGLESL